ETYVFRGDRFARFTGPDLEFADAGFHAPVKDAWGDLPREFEQGVDGAFVLGDAVYLARGESYVRYSNADFHRVDATFPRSFAAMWRSRAPFALEDLRLLGRLKQLDEAGREPGGLVALLDRALGVRATPYERLAELFGWNVDDVSWLGRRHAFLTRPADGAPESIEWAVRTADVLALCAKFGRSPAEVYTQVWSRLYGAEEDSEGGGHEIAGRRFPTYASASAAADVLERWLAAQPAPPAGEAPQRRARRALDERKRDALVAYLLTCPTVDDGHIDSLPTSARDLYERHLIDVEMSGEVESTRVLEAIAAVQLFLHRCLLRLEESAGADNDADDRLLGELKQWWGWMKNYRTWEANRKVFLYPENYLRPELRDTKTRQFKSLEERLAQPDVSPESYELAFKEYLDAFTEVSKLLVAGGCVYVSPDQSGDLCLSLFGRTASDPLKFYHRRATFVGGT
ncbi:MAG TPA: hypothetical protein PLV92_24360, partial [Pirellulaceae bacterium]|nr:hypothetical protein [Pirellulaceae bacterium]